MKLSVDIIVPTYGNWPLVEACLRSILEQTDASHVVVVDDLSPDDTAQRIQEAFPSIRFLRNEKNLGFARTCNRGIGSSSADVVILVNSDVVADQGMVQNLVSAFEDDEHVGSSTPLLMKPNGRVDGFGISVDSTLSGFVRYAGRDRSEVGQSEHSVVAAYGAVAAFRRQALQQVGLLDENIFMYGEELDLGLRLRAAGWKCVATESATGVHVGGASIGLGSYKQREQAAFGRGYMVRAYRVLATRYAIRTVATDTLICLADVLLNRDFAATRGRIRGWQAGKHAPAKPALIQLSLSRISFIESLRLRWKVIGK